ncbi:MAG TPA: carboxypeptidase regulatory-like domain-containing protein [Bryobacteraceae bacterium]|jgi:hypothetical protein|nr:carboxypeptidase regulatory-like domain-containing protein [Bryobacteraceae bacterium]
MLRIAEKSLFFGFATLLIAQFVLSGQTTDTATIHGHILDQNRGAVSGAQVTLISAASSLKRTTRTDAQGDFTITTLPVDGNYTVTAVKEGFGPAKLAGIALQSGAAAEINIQLNVASENAQITVTGVAGEIRTDAPQLGDRIAGRQLQETPMLDRRITYLPLLNSANRPAINQGDIFTNQNLFTTNGAGRRQTWFEVDGSTGTDSWGRQTIFTTIPLPALQEMTVLENTFSAEYGGSTGSAVNIITRTGGNRLRGELLEVWRPSATEAALSGFTSTNAASGNDLNSNTLGQTDLSLGGPIGTDRRTHFFTAGEFARENRVSPIISPIAPGGYDGHYRGWLGFLRLDRQLNDRNTIFFRSGVDAFHDTNPNGIVGGNSLPTVARVFRRRTYSEELGETSVFTPSLVNNVRLQFQLASPITEFDPVVYGTQYQVPVSTGGTFTTGTSQSALLLNRQYQLADTLTYIHGRHTLNFGASSIVARSGGNSKEFGGPIYLGQFIYKTCTQALTICESPAYLNNIANVATYTQSYGNANYLVNDVLWSVFAQDDFRPRPDFTINLGIRYERQTFTDFQKGFAPRAGFSWNPRADGKTVIRGGFGIYYSQITDNSAANYALTGPTGVFNYSAAPGQIGFPATVASAPLPAFPVGAQTPLRSLYIRPGNAAYLNQFFPTSVLAGYPGQLLNPYSEQWTFGVERKIATGWVLRADYVGSHTLRINRPLDVDAPASFIRTAQGQTRTAQAANCTRPYWIWWYAQQGLTCNPLAATNPQPPYSVIQSDVNDGYSYYDALQVNLNGRVGAKFNMMVSYTWSHAIDNVDPDLPSQNPNDPNFAGRIENANAVFDQRHRLVLSGIYVAKWGIHIGGLVTIASGLPYNFVTGTNNSGDTGATTDRPVINGVVVGRNAGRGTPTYEISPLMERPFRINEHLRIEPRIEVFNLLNHPNFAGFSGTYGNGIAPGAGFGQPLAGITNQFPARSIQFAIKVTI